MATSSFVARNDVILGFAVNQLSPDPAVAVVNEDRGVASEYIVRVLAG